MSSQPLHVMKNLERKRMSLQPLDIMKNHEIQNVIIIIRLKKIIAPIYCIE